jgi:hypothetical protein
MEAMMRLACAARRLVVAGWILSMPLRGNAQDATVRAPTPNGIPQTADQPPVAIEELTVPADRLSSGCALATEPSRDRNGVRTAQWPDFPTNPWIGTDRRLMAEIRERVDPPAALPDGPPLDAKELSRYRAQFADGLAQGYHAVYDDAAQRVIVQAVKFAPTEPASAFASGRARVSSAREVRVGIGRIAAIVTGDGACSRAVSAYLASLANR